MEFQRGLAIFSSRTVLLWPCLNTDVTKILNFFSWSASIKRLEIKTLDSFFFKFLKLDT
jgi:hypothetical protein